MFYLKALILFLKYFLFYPDVSTRLRILVYFRMKVAKMGGILLLKTHNFLCFSSIAPPANFYRSEVYTTRFPALLLLIEAEF